MPFIVSDGTHGQIFNEATQGGNPYDWGTPDYYEFETDRLRNQAEYEAALNGDSTYSYEPYQTPNLQFINTGAREVAQLNMPAPLSFDAPTMAGSAHNFAQGMVNVVANLGANLAGEASSLQTPLIDAPSIPSFDTPTFNLPDAPQTTTDLPSDFPVAPNTPNLAAVTLDDPGPVPDDQIATIVPNLNIAAPTPFTDSPPSAEALDPVPIPDAPSLVLPSPPSLQSVTIPDIPTINLPQFVAQLGDAPIAPDVSFSWTEDIYSSPLLDAVVAKYLNEINNGISTGLDPAVENALWARARDRAAETYLDAGEQVLREQAARGFPLPPGAANVALERIGEAARREVANTNREIAIEQARLEQSNRQFVLAQSYQIEATMVGYASQRAQRAFDAARYVVEAAVAVYGAKVQQYNADVTAFQARATVYGEQIRGEIARIEVYKAQIEGQKLITDLNDSTVRTYVAQLDAVTKQVEIYEAEVNAARLISETNRTKIEAFRAYVEAYGERVRAKTAEYQGYQTQIQAEVAKLEVPRVQAETFKARIDAYTARVTAETQRKQLEVDIKQRVPVEIYKTQIDAFAAETGAIAERVKALADLFKVDADIYDAQVRGEAARVGALADVIRANAGIAEAQANVAVETLRTNAASLIETARLKIEGVRAQAAAMSQLAASAMNAVNFSVSASESQSTSLAGHISQTASESYSLNEANSVSKTEAYNRMHTTSG